MEQLPALFELARAYHSARDVDSLTKTFTTHVGPRLKARARP